MLSLREVKQALRNGPYAWPGGYPIYFVTTDGDALSFKAVRAHWRDVCAAHMICGWRHSGWSIAAVATNWEDTDLYCDDTGERIESGYAEDYT